MSEVVHIRVPALQPWRAWPVGSAVRALSVGATLVKTRWLPRFAVCGCALLAGILLVVIAAPRSGTVRETAVTPRARDAAAGLARLRSLSLQGQAVISGTLGAADPAFAAERSDGGFRLAGGGLDAEVRDGRLSVGAGGESLSMSLAGVGQADRLGALGAAVESARHNRVAVAYPGVVEWYAAGPLGIEQGFTVTRRPAGGGPGPLTLALRLGGGLRPVFAGSQVRFLARGGRVINRYGGLVAFDATGRQLPAKLVLVERSLLLRIADRGAVYPLRIDPFVEQLKIVPGDESPGGGDFGGSVAVSSDGNTALIGAGGPLGGAGGRHASCDDSYVCVGGAWVFSRSGNTWSEQQKIVPADETGREPGSNFGGSVHVRR